MWQESLSRNQVLGQASAGVLVVLLSTLLAVPAIGQDLDVSPGESADAQMQDLEDVPEAEPRAGIVEFPLPTPQTGKAKADAGAPGDEPASAAAK